MHLRFGQHLRPRFGIFRSIVAFRSFIVVFLELSMVLAATPGHSSSSCNHELFSCFPSSSTRPCDLLVHRCGTSITPLIVTEHPEDLETSGYSSKPYTQRGFESSSLTRAKTNCLGRALEKATKVFNMSSTSMWALTTLCAPYTLEFRESRASNRAFWSESTHGTCREARGNGDLMAPVTFQRATMPLSGREGPGAGIQETVPSLC